VRLGLGLLLAIVMAGRAVATEVSLDWSLSDRLQGPASIDQTASPQQLPLRVDVNGPCPVRPSFVVDSTAAAVTELMPCSFSLPAVSPGPHHLQMAAGSEHGALDFTARDLLVVSIGDSVASGEGNPDGPGPKWLLKRCHRSLQSGVALAAQALELGDRHSAITFVPLACSGATISKGLIGPYKGVGKNTGRPPLAPQVDVLAALKRPIDALLISIGANDVNFGPFLRFCALVKSCLTRRFDPQHPYSEAPKGFPSAAQVEQQALARLPGLYDALAKRLTGHVEAHNTIIVDYFDPLRDAQGQLCKHPLGLITMGEEQWVEANLLVPLDAAVEAAARRHGWQVVDGVAEAFRRHGICAGEQSWITSLGTSGVAELSPLGTMHPNPAGHRAEAALIAPLLASTLGVAPAIEQIEPSHHGYVHWWWILVAVAGTALALVGGWLIGRR